MGYKVNKHLCVVALSFLGRTTTVVDITQRLQSGKSLDRGLERLYMTLNSLKYNIRIASKLQLVRLFPRTLKKLHHPATPSLVGLVYFQERFSQDTDNATN